MSGSDRLSYLSEFEPSQKEIIRNHIKRFRWFAQKLNSTNWKELQYGVTNWGNENENQCPLNKSILRRFNWR